MCMQKSNRRWLLVVGLAAPFLVALVGGTLAVASGQFSPAEPDEQTYLIESVVIRDSSDLTPAAMETGFTAVLELTYSWREGVYPGPAECRIEYFDMNGNSVGSERMELDAYTESGTMTLPGRVPESAASGVGECAGGVRPDPDNRILVSNVSISEYAPEAAYNPDAEVGARLSATAHWVSEENPRAQQCLLTAVSSSGSGLLFAFTAEVANGQDFGIRVPTSFLGSSDAKVECHRYEGAGQ